MKKLKRTHKDYGGGTGRHVYESELFEVVHWNMRNGPMTEVCINFTPYYGLKVRFAGYIDFKTDDDCMAQYTAREVLKMMRSAQKQSFREGQVAQQETIRKALGMRR